MSPLRLIVNGDDFGRDVCVNEAIIQAHEQGVLTSASLMVTGDAVQDAIDRARAHPTLAVGLHLALTAVPSVLDACQVPHLLGAEGRLPRSPARAGFACFFNPAVRSELQREIAAQFERFIETGLVLSHVDSHHLLHLHPTVLPLVLPLAVQHGAAGVRLARGELWPSLRLDRRQLAGKVALASVYALLCRLAVRQVARSPLVFTDRVYGLLQSGSMHEALVAGLLQHIPPAVGSAELYVHPSTQTCDGPHGPNPGDLAALLSPRVRQAIDERGTQLTTYPALGVSSQRRVACPGH